MGEFMTRADFVRVKRMDEAAEQAKEVRKAKEQNKAFLSQQKERFRKRGVILREERFQTEEKITWASLISTSARFATGSVSVSGSFISCPCPSFRLPASGNREKRPSRNAPWSRNRLRLRQSVEDPAEVNLTDAGMPSNPAMERDCPRA
jgi:hypothetical protein